MLTVKHVEPNGYECVRTARVVDYEPTRPGKRARVTAYGCDCATVDTQTVADKDGVLRFETGRVYVMDAGKTVSAYVLTR